MACHTSFCGVCQLEASSNAPALMLNKSSLLMPGLRGTPAGMMTSCAPCRAADRESGPVCQVTCRTHVISSRPGVLPAPPGRQVLAHLHAAVNVGEVSCHALCAHDVIQAQLPHQWVPVRCGLSGAHCCSRLLQITVSTAHIFSMRARGWPIPPAAPAQPIGLDSTGYGVQACCNSAGPHRTRPP